MVSIEGCGVIIKDFFGDAKGCIDLSTQKNERKRQYLTKFKWNNENSTVLLSSINGVIKKALKWFGNSHSLVSDICSKLVKLH